MTTAVGGDDFAGDHLTGLDLVQLEVFGVAEVLENFAVFISNCYFHGLLPPSCFFHEGLYPKKKKMATVETKQLP